MMGFTMRSAVALSAYAIASVAGEFTQYGSSPPVYPSPNVTGAGGWDAALQKAQAFLDQLTLEEKTGFVTGTPGPCSGNIAPVPRLNFRGLCLMDGPLAIRQAVYASVFPAGISVAASWDRDLARLRGQYIGEEFKGKGSHVMLGPVVGPLGHSPFGGRNWEGFSPDSYLSGELVYDTVTGIQSAGTQACTKHYILNEQETQRNPSTTANGTTIEAISSNVDDRTMHETYLWPFANAVKAGTASIMCSYNRINGSYGCQNSKTLNGLLKEELGFNGYVMSDWGGTHSGVPAIEAGLDMNMPGGIGFVTASPSYFGQNLTDAVNNGSLDISRLNDQVLRVLTPYFQLGQDVDFPLVDGSDSANGFFPKANYVYNFTTGPLVDVRANHASLIRELGAAGHVLLKNTNNALPLKKPSNIAVLGNDAADLTDGLYSLSSGSLTNGDYDIGTLPVGGGSGTGRLTYVVPPLDAIKAKAAGWGALVQYITDNSFITGSSGILETSLVPLPEVAIVFLKSFATEGLDRSSLIPEWNSTAVVEAATAVCSNVIVVIHGTGPDVLPWKDNENVTAIIAAHFPGQETGNAVVDVLWGDVNPSGKLPYTIANSEADYQTHILNSTALAETTDPDAWDQDFTEGQLIDYKQFDAQNKSVAYEFGFGLSYTTFSLANLQSSVVVANASRLPSTTAQIARGGNVELWDTLVTVSATLTNTGNIAGATVPQLYLSLPASEAGAGTPVRVLRGFEKVSLAGGASQTVTFSLLRRDLSFWDTVSQAWRLPTGSIGVSVGFSSRDLPLTGSLTV